MKAVDNTTIHVSRVLLGSFGPLYLCDLGEARVGSQHQAIAMPIRYRAPEIILGMSWGHSVDMWSVGLLVWLRFLISPLLVPFPFPPLHLSLLTSLRLPSCCFYLPGINILHQAWDLLEAESLFHLYDANDLALNDAQYLANMTALLGPPPLEFLKGNPKSRDYWDEKGKPKILTVFVKHTDTSQLF